METIKLLSLNLHCGLEDEYDKKMDIIVEMIAQNDLDIIVLQECVQNKFQPAITTHYGIKIKEGNLCKNMVDLLYEKYGLHYDYYFDWGKYGYEVLEEGLAILSRKKILAVESRYVSKSKRLEEWWVRKLISVTIAPKTKIYAIHLGWWDDEKDPFIDQVNLLKAWTNKMPDYRHLMVGDFNNPAGGVGYHYMKTKLGFKDLYYEANPKGFNDNTFIASVNNLDHELDNENQRIDYFMSVGIGVKALSLKRVFTGERYPIVSDHFGLMGHLKLE